MDHISTEDAARDMDALRGALGEQRPSFPGQSYGTFLGTVYANLCPERVGRFVFERLLGAADRGASFLAGAEQALGDPTGEVGSLVADPDQPARRRRPDRRAWDDSACGPWPTSTEGYRGPGDARTDEPVLVVNSRSDPATPLAAAQRLHALLPNSALLVHERAGPVAAQQSACVVEATSRHLTDGTVPDAPCAPDRVPLR